MLLKKLYQYLDPLRSSAISTILNKEPLNFFIINFLFNVNLKSHKLFNFLKINDQKLKKKHKETKIEFAGW